MSMLVHLIVLAVFAQGPAATETVRTELPTTSDFKLTLDEHRTYDLAGRLTGITYPNDPAVAFYYDELRAPRFDNCRTPSLVDWPAQPHTTGRLSSVLMANTAVHFAYDDHGRVIRRLGKRVDDPEYRLEYHYQPGSSRIEHINSGVMVDGSVSVPQRRHVLTHSPTGEVLGLESQQPDGNGGWSSGGGATLVYDDAGRLMSLDAGALTTFAYDYRHLRTSKQGSVMAPATQFYYDDDGSLLAEIGCWDSSCYGSRPVREYIWFAGRPVAYVRAQLNSNRTVDDTGDGNPLSGANKGVFPIHTGLLGEPRAISNGAGAVAWRATYTPWGEARLDSTNSFTFNLRLPGMYADVETDLSYNWHRYYAPFLGRYMQADPLLSQGVWQPAYAYAAGRPTSRIDLDGQEPITLTAAYIAFEISATAYDVYDTARTLNDPCARDWEKWVSVGGLAAGVILPGGGWGTAAKKGVKFAGEAAERAGVAAAKATARAVDPNKLNHIFGKAEHVLDDFVTVSGGRETAFRRIQDAANAALRDGRLSVGPNGLLPNGNAGPIIDVGGTQIRLITGRAVDGVVQIASASRRGLP